MIQVPDLLHLDPRLEVDPSTLSELVGLGFMGKDSGEELDRALTGRTPKEACGWQARFFVEDLFLRELIQDSFTLELEGRRIPVQEGFLLRVLSDPPTRADSIRFRQEILRELTAVPEIRERTERLYGALHTLLSMFKVPGPAARLDINTFRLDLLRQAKSVMDDMVESFGEATSGLRRLHEVGRQIRESSEYRILSALLDLESRLATLDVQLRVGATGKITDLKIDGVRENRGNPFYRSPAGRWLDRLRYGVWNGYRLDDEEIVGRLVQEVFVQVSSALILLLQLIGQLELYLTSLRFAERVRDLGLQVCLAEIGEAPQPLELERLFNPLLLRQAEVPVPCDLRQTTEGAVSVVTGPNSGGKTRLLQALGLAQLLGQSGLYTPAATARMSVMRGMFASLIEREAVDQTEGRLGQELRRLRAMFEAMEAPSMVILDELCAGTNPSEGIEVFTHVLRLLEPLRPISFVTTHFLDFARRLEREPPVERLEFLQVEVDDHQVSTYQFLPGVAATSLAAVMARRLGVTFEELSSSIRDR